MINHLVRTADMASSSLMGLWFLFQEYIIHVDPVSQLGLNSDSVLGYSIGEIKRSNASDTPELLPCGYLVGENTTISVAIKGNQASPGWIPGNFSFLFCAWALETDASVCLSVWVGGWFYFFSPSNHNYSYLSKLNCLHLFPPLEETNHGCLLQKSSNKSSH